MLHLERADSSYCAWVLLDQPVGVLRSILYLSAVSIIPATADTNMKADANIRFQHKI